MPLMIHLLYAAATVLYGALFVITWRRGWRDPINHTYLWLLLGWLFWTVTLYLYLFVPLGDWLLFVGRLNYAVAVPIPAALAAFFYYFPRVDFEFPTWFRRISLISSIALGYVSQFTPWIDANEVMTPSGPEVTLGVGYPWYIVHFFGFFFIAFLIGFAKLRRARGVERVKLGYAFWAFVPTVVVLAVSNVILPMYQVFAHLPYTFLIGVPVAVISFYAMFRYRFLDIRLRFSRWIRGVIAVLVAIGAASFIFVAIRERRPELLEYHEVWVSALMLGTYFVMDILLETTPARRLFGSGNAEFFRSELHDLQTRNVVYTTLEELGFDVRQTFEEKLRLASSRIILIDDLSSLLPRELRRRRIRECFLGAGPVVRTELPFILRGRTHTRRALTAAMDALGAEVVVPLFRPPRTPIAILILGPKPQHEPYYAEEISSLGQIGVHLGLALTGILFQRDLRRELDRKTRALREHNERVHGYVTEQSELMALAAHELRTAIAVPLLQAGELEAELGTDSRAAKASEVQDTLLHLTSLVNRYFDAQKCDLRMMSFHPEETALLPFFSAAAERLAGTVRQKDIGFTFTPELPEGLRLPVDRTQMRQVVENLVSNAVKFTPGGGEITLGVRVDRDELEISVTDTGPGIPEEIRPTLFQKFARGTSRLRGMGIGLYLARRIAELHGGDISATNVPGAGARIAVRIPLVVRERRE